MNHYCNLLIEKTVVVYRKFPNRHSNFTYIVHADSQQCLGYDYTLILKCSKYGVDFQLQNLSSTSIHKFSQETNADI